MTESTRTHSVSLGCGTLILIALIVLIFSGRNSESIEREIRDLRCEIGALKESVEAQTNQLKLLQEKLSKEFKAETGDDN